MSIWEKLIRCYVWNLRWVAIKHRLSYVPSAFYRLFASVFVLAVSPIALAWGFIFQPALVAFTIEDSKMERIKEVMESAKKSSK